MTIDFTNLNYGALIAAAFAFFAIGSLWFSALFGAIWQEELKKHGVSLPQPTGSMIAAKMALTFLQNVVAAFGMALLVQASGSATLFSGLLLGLIVAVCFAATAIGGVFTWENRSMKLFLIDTGYPFFGIIATAIILSLWQ